MTLTLVDFDCAEQRDPVRVIGHMCIFEKQAHCIEEPCAAGSLRSCKCIGGNKYG